MMEESLEQFGLQFNWVPQVENADNLAKTHTYYLAVGMGGSHLPAWLLWQYSGLSNITIHRDYGLPICHEGTLVILTSYSGNTEEVLDAARVAHARKTPLAIITRGGELLQFAKDHQVPHVVLPQFNLEPRMATGLMMLAMTRLMGNTDLEQAIRNAGKMVNPSEHKTDAENLAKSLRAKIPVIYSSAANESLAYIWKINFNETAKIPASFNVFPELCHNEISGFDVVESTKALAGSLAPVFLADMSDHPRVQKRMEVLKGILEEKNSHVEQLFLLGAGFEKAFRSILFSNWTAMYLAQYYGVPNPETPLIAEFKRRMIEV